jgi:hypothetical protein
VPRGEGGGGVQPDTSASKIQYHALNSRIMTAIRKKTSRKTSTTAHGGGGGVSTGGGASDSLDLLRLDFAQTIDLTDQHCHAQVLEGSSVGVATLLDP